MSNSVRAWVLLVVTLLLGIAIGVLGAGALQERRVARVNEIRRPGGFVEHVRSVIRPTSDSQWSAIRPLVQATADENMRMRRMHESALRAALDTLRTRLDPMLDDQQRSRLARFVPPRPGGPSRPGGPGGAGGRRGRGRGDRQPPDGDPGPPPPP
jgi:hypothetical protein